MSKWVSVFASGVLTSSLFALAIALLFDEEPVGFLHLFVFAALLCSSWWFAKIVRTPGVQEEPQEQEMEALPLGKTVFFLLAVLAVFPWAIIWVAFIAPVFGLQNVPIKFHLIFILGIPLAALWLRDKMKSRDGDE